MIAGFLFFIARASVFVVMCLRLKENIAYLLWFYLVVSNF